MKLLNFSNKIKIVIGIIVTIILFVLSILVYINVIKPQKYNEYMNTGNVCLSQKDYNSAIESFKKALELNENSVEARLGKAKGYMGIDNTDKVKELLIDAQKLDIRNESALVSILRILDEIDLEFSNELVKKYVYEVGKNNVSNRFRSEILELSDKNDIGIAIKKAQVLYDNSTEGELEGQYEEGSKAILLRAINDAKSVNCKYIVEQLEVDKALEKLNESMSILKGKQVKSSLIY